MTLQLFADGLPEVTGFGFNIEFDPNMLNYVEKSFALGDFIPEATAVATNKGEIIDAGGASLAGASGNGNGFLAMLDFKVTDASAVWYILVNLGEWHLTSSGVA